MQICTGALKFNQSVNKFLVLIGSLLSDWNMITFRAVIKF